MRLRLSIAIIFCLILTGGIFSMILNAQGIRGPVLGYVPDAGGTAVRPVLGVPGAAGLGTSLPLTSSVSRIRISAGQDYAIAVRDSDAKVVVVDLLTGTTSVRPPELPIKADVLFLSPLGSTAVAYVHGSNAVHTIGDLPRARGHVRVWDLSRVPGRPVGFSASDDGELVLVKSDGGTWIMGVEFSWRVPAENPIVAFVPGSRDIIVADNSTGDVFLVKDVGGSYQRVPVFSATSDNKEFAAVMASVDGKRIFAAAVSGVVTIVDLTTGNLSSISCHCRPLILEALKGDSVFRLTEVSGEPIMVLDASLATPRMGMIPSNALQ
jgi:WD40 repeat protein